MPLTLKQKRRPLFLLIAFAASVLGVVAPLSLPNSARAAACQLPSTDYGSVTMNVSLPSAATYRVWSRINVPSSTNNTYLLELDGNKCYTVGGGSITANTWVWIAYQNGTATSKIDVSLGAGSHSLKLIGNKPDVKIDRLVFASDLTCVPSGSGDNCNTPTDTTAPTARITAPAANSSVSGTATVTATATDDTGVKKVELYVNGILSGTDDTSPYSFSWNTAAIPNGPQALAARAYDAAGNVGTDSISVTVQNGDRQAPSIPSSLKATASAYNLVALSWQASTDDTGVKGYHVFRDGVPLADVGATTTYNDSSVSAGTTYSYKVSAFDAAGNTSNLSTAVSVTTPTVADIQAPTTPMALAAAAASTTQVNLNWQASTDNIGVTGYDIYRTTRGSSFKKIGTSQATDFADTNLKANTTYSYYVIAKDAAGNRSQKSNTAKVTTLSPTTVTQTSASVVGVITKDTGKNKVSASSLDSSYANIVFTDGKHRHIYQTNRRGAYAIRSLEPGRYNFIYRANGYYSKTVSVKVVAPTTTQNVSLQKR